MPLSTYLVVAPIAYLIICLTFIYLGWSYKKTLKTSEVLLLSLSAVIGIMLGLVLIFELLPLLWDYILPLFEGALHQAPFFVS